MIMLEGLVVLPRSLFDADMISVSSPGLSLALCSRGKDSDIAASRVAPRSSCTFFSSSFTFMSYRRSTEEEEKEEEEEGKDANDDDMVEEGKDANDDDMVTTKK